MSDLLNASENEGTTDMPREALRPKGWLAERLDAMGLSVHGFCELLDEHYKQGLRWNSGVYDPPTPVMEWLGKVERFFAENPPPRRATYVVPVHSAVAEPPSAFVKRIIDALKPGETATTEEIRVRIGARRKAVEQRLAAASVTGRLGALRRVDGGVYRARAGEVPPGGFLTFDPVVEPAAPTFVGRILDVVMPGETVEIAKVARRIGMRPDALHRQVAKAAEANRLGPIARVGEDRIRRVEDDHGDKASVPETKQESVTLPAPTAPPPPAAPAPVAAVRPAAKPAEVPLMTTDEGRQHLDFLGWSQRDLGDILKWPGTAQREVRRWFQDHERFPMPPEVATWLRGVVEAKRAAETALPAGIPESAKAAVVAAAIASAIGDPTKVRDTALEARRQRPRQQHVPAEVVVSPLPSAPKVQRPAGLALTASDRDVAEAAALLSQEVEPVRSRVALKDRWSHLEAALRRTFRAGQPMEAWVAAASAWLLQEDPSQEPRAPAPTTDVAKAPEPRVPENVAMVLARLGRGWTAEADLGFRLGSEEAAAQLGFVEFGDEGLRLTEAGLAKQREMMADLALREGFFAVDDPSVVPGVSVRTFYTAVRRVLRWVVGDGSLDELPADDPAHEDARAALLVTHAPDMTLDAWVAAAEAKLEEMGYAVDEGEDDEVPETVEVLTLEPDRAGHSGRGERFVDLTKEEG